jgi:hypothetical protein
MAHLAMWKRTPRVAASAVTVAAVVAGLLALGPAAEAATINVNCSTQSLQAKIESAPAGSTLLVKGTCIGNFSFAKTLTIEGSPTATLDGDDAGPVLSITGIHPAHLIALTITGGLSGSGAGIHHQGNGPLTLDKVTVERNLATGFSFAQGGGIFSNGGALKLTGSSVVDNRSLAAAPGAGNEADGGGIYSVGALTLVGSTVSSNRATATSTGAAVAQGGGIFQMDGPISVTSSHVDLNRATSLPSGFGGARGGGMYATASSSAMSIVKSSFDGNVLTASSTSGATVAFGGAVNGTFDHGAVSASTFAGNQLSASSPGNDAAAAGGAFEANFANGLTVSSSRFTGSRLSASASGDSSVSGGSFVMDGALSIGSSVLSLATLVAKSDVGDVHMAGGAIFQSSGLLSLTRSSIDRNHMSGSSNSGSATVRGGGLLVGAAAKIVASTVSRNTVSASTADPSTAALGAGAGLDLQGAANAAITNSTIAGNTAAAKSPAATGTTTVLGGGIRNEQATLLLTNTSVARNGVSGSGHTLAVHGGGLLVEAGAATLEATILALNTAPTGGGPNCSGPVGSDGYNLLGTKVGCTFTAKPTDKLNQNPKLGALANNGGPTLTLALLTGSPAINAIPAASCAVPKDQRGVPRPQGPKCDIGSYEKKP